jgi:hypothetical protein
MRPLEWIAVRVSHRRERDGRLTAETMSSWVYVDRFEADQGKRRDLVYILLRRDLAACLDSF